MKAAVGSVLALLLLGCTTRVPQPTEYLLRADVPERTLRVEEPVSIGLRRVQVAPYLDQTGLVVETDAHQVRAARYHRWAEPLDRGLQRFLRAEMSNELGRDVEGDAAGPSDYQVDVYVDELHGTLSGEARLVASWRIVRGAGTAELAAFRFAKSQPLVRPGYAALVEAEIELLRQLAAGIAGSLREEIRRASGAS